MKTTKLQNKLSFRIPLQAAGGIAVIMTVIAVALYLVLLPLVENNTKEKIEFLAEENANLASSYLNNMQAQASVLSKAVLQYQGTEQNVATVPITKLLYSVLTDQRIFSAYIALEPNAFFPGTDDGLSYYVYRDGDSLKFDIYEDYESYNEGEYYAVTKETLKPHITEPYQYTLSNGDTVWLITISEPILDNGGRFLGVTNCDILTDTINNLPYDMGGFGTAYSYILSNSGAYLAHSADKSLMGNTYGTLGGNPGTEAADANREHILDITKTGAQDLFDDINTIYGGDAYKVHVPVIVEGIDQNLSSAFVVGKSEALSSVSGVLWVVMLISLCGLLILAGLIMVLIRRSVKPLDVIVQAAEDMKNGNLSAEISVHTKDEFGTLAEVFRETGSTLNGYVQDISHTLGELARGNLTAEMQGDYVGDFAPIKESLITITEELNRALSVIREAAEQVNAGAEQVSGGAQSLSQGSMEQASSIQQLSASITEVSEKVRQNAEYVRTAAGYVNEVGTDIGQSNGYMQSMTDAMNEINNSSREISKIIKVIDDIAFQTNILALNAAVEAARAGAAGKGFAVVADEVRNLASKSADAAKQTTALIESSVQSVEKGAKIAEQTAKALESVVDKTRLVEASVGNINAASSEQASAIEQINKGVEQIALVVQTNSATAEESAAASEELSSQATMLREQIDRFQLKGGDFAASSVRDIDTEW